jgi:hypothetical protein
MQRRADEMVMEKTQGLKDLIAWAKKRARNYKGPKEKTDHDLIAHGISKDTKRKTGKSRKRKKKELAKRI